MRTMRWLLPRFKLKFYPESLPEIEKAVRNLIREVNDKHPFWDDKNRLRVKEIFIYIEDQDIEANIDWKFNFKLILMTIGLVDMVKKEFRMNLGESIFREDLSKDILNIEGLRTLLFHEFSHPLDMANHKFFYCQSPTLSGPQSFLVMSLWNCHIDGRLTRMGIQTVLDLPSRLGEILSLDWMKVESEVTKNKIVEALWAAWNADFMTHREMIDIAHEKIPFKLGDDSQFDTVRQGHKGEGSTCG